MENAKEHRKIEVFLPGFLQLLGSQFYSDPKACIRELIQNAHDSCIRRRIKERGAAPAIRLRFDRGRKTLTFHDNGDGMTREEIHQYLATIGRSLTAEVREQLKNANAAEADKLIGEFGLGLLSAFALGNRLEITTRSCQPGSQALKWQCVADGSYIIEEGGEGEVGSQVTIFLEDRHLDVLDEELVKKAIKEYADLLSIPIYFGRGLRPVNAMHAPWHLGDAATEVHYIDYLSGRFDIPPMEVIRIFHKDDIQVFGALYIPQATKGAPAAYGDLAVYVRSMFITEQERGLLPRWGQFIRGIIDSPSLSLTLSRGDLILDEAYQRVQAFLGEQILLHLEQLAQSAPNRLKQIVTAHNLVIKRCALEDDGFFKRIAHLVQFDTDEGKTTIPQYLERLGDSKIFYVKGDERGIQQKLLFQARGIPVFDASWNIDELFLKKYGYLNNVPVQASEEDLFQPVTEDPEWKTLRRECAHSLHLEARIVSFDPGDLPAVLVTEKKEPAEERNKIEKFMRIILSPAGEMEKAKALVGLMTEQETAETQETGFQESILYLNARNSVIMMLRNLNPIEPVYATALKGIYNNAVLLSQQNITPEKALKICRDNNDSVKSLVQQAHVIKKLETELEKNRTRNQ